MTTAWLLVLFYTITINANELSGSTSTLYIGKHFEIRDHDAPTKYVFNGQTRVARIPGSISSNPRIQHLRLFPGWNLCSLAVSASGNLFHQFSSAYRWESETKSWVNAAGNSNLPAGTVLWLKATSSTILSIVGPRIPPAARSISPPGDFVAGLGFDVCDFKSAISNFSSAVVWTYDASSMRWLCWLPLPLRTQHASPDFISPGEALFIQTEDGDQVDIHDSAPQLLYYHQDHLGSTAIVIDSYAHLTKTPTFYPFGAGRQSSGSMTGFEPYGFTQKETDRETALQYFEARYQHPAFSRFVSVDPIVLEPPDTQSMQNAQSLNAYAYCFNNPARFEDPSGRQVWQKPFPFNKHLVKQIGKEFYWGGIDLLTAVVTFPVELWTGGSSAHAPERISRDHPLEPSESLQAQAAKMALTKALAYALGALITKLSTPAKTALAADESAAARIVARPGVARAGEYPGGYVNYAWEGGGRAQFIIRGREVVVDYLNRGGAPKGSAGRMLADSLRSAGVNRPASLYAPNILPKAANSNELIESALRQTASELGATVRSVTQGVDAGKHWIRLDLDY